MATSSSSTNRTTTEGGEGQAATEHDVDLRAIEMDVNSQQSVNAAITQIVDVPGLAFWDRGLEACAAASMSSSAVHGSRRIAMSRLG
jgi:hypothetical protein